MKIQPTQDRVLIKPIEVEQTTEGGIILQQSDSAAAPTSGVVLAVGKGMFRDGLYSPMEARPGDAVLFNKFAGTPVEQEGEQLVLMHDTDVIAILASPPGAAVTNIDAGDAVINTPLKDNE